MLSAEHYALESEVVRTALDLRRQEVEYFSDRFSSVGSQTAFLLFFTCGSIANFQSKAEDGVPLTWVYIFEISAAVTLTTGIHTSLNSTFASIWGAGLSLRGPKGSVLKAYYGLKKESKHVMRSYLICIGSFMCHFMSIFWYMNHDKTQQPSQGFALEISTSVTILLCFMTSTWFIVSMRRKLKFDKTALRNLEKDYAAISVTTSGDATSEVVEGSSNGIGVTGTTQADTGPLLLCSGHKGKLEKRGRRTGAWTSRYFALQSGTMYEFKNENTYAKHVRKHGTTLSPANVSATKTYSVAAYEAFVEVGQAGQHQFILRPLDDEDQSLRAREYRCSTEAEHRLWLQMLVFSQATER